MNRKLLMILSLILSVVFMSAHFFFGCRFKIDNIVIVGETEAGSVIVNDDDSDITFLLMSDTRLDRARGSISIKKFFDSPDGERGFNYPIGVVENGGKVYFLNRKDYFSGRGCEYEVCLLDFNKSRFDVIFSFSDSEIQKKLKNYPLDENNDFSESSNIIYQTFDVDDDGVVIYFTADKEDRDTGEVVRSIYLCHLIGGELNDAEFVSKSGSEYDIVTGLFENGICEIDIHYNLWISGEKVSDISKTRYSDLFGYSDRMVIGKSIDNTLYLIDIEEKTQTPFDDLNGIIANAGLYVSDVEDLYKIGGSTVVVFSDGERSFLFNSNSGGMTDAVYVESTFEFIIHCLISIVLAFACVWLIGLLVYLLKTRGRVSIKFAAIAAPVMFGCDLAAYGFICFGINVIEENIFFESLNAVSQQQVSLELTNDIGDFNEGGEYLNEIDRAVLTFENTIVLNQLYTSEDSEIKTQFAYLGYAREDDIFVNMIDMIYGDFDINALCSYRSKTREKIMRAVESRSDEYCTTYSDGVEYVTLISPTYFSGDNSVNGVYIFTVSAAEVRYNTNGLLRRLTVYKLILSTVIALLFTLLTWFMLRGLKRLQKKSADYLSGGYAISFEREKRRGGIANEIDVISDKFNQLLESVNRDFNEIDNLRKANIAYFSDVILKIFNKKTINSVKIGEYAEAEAYCIEALLPKKYANFDCMNNLLTALGKKLREYGAFASDIDSTSLSVYSLEADAVNILFFLREYDKGIIAAADKCYIEIGFVSIGGSCRCIVRREDALREDILKNTLINTGSSAAVTEKAADARGGELSMICVGMVDNDFIYDISDGIQDRFENSIRDQLKRGIELYFNGDHTAAREMFVIILKRQQKNPIARYYIELIDGSKQKEGALQ